MVSIGYASGEFMDKANSPQRSFSDAQSTIAAALESAEIKPELRTQLAGDLQAFTEALAKHMPKAGELSAITYLTARGYESFRYNAGTRPDMDSSQPLAILNHVGGSPMCVIAGHGGDMSQAYDAMVPLLKPLFIDVEKIAESKSSAIEWAEYQKYRDRFLELARRLEFTTREKVLPALRANEQALVFDVASKSDRWFAPMPKSPQPLPMLEAGLVCHVSNATLLRQGVSDYVSIAEDGSRLLHEIKPDNFPQFELPPPQERNVPGGKLYSFPFPAEWGVDSQLAANAALTEDVAVMSMLPDFTGQLLKPVPATIDTTLDLKRPAALVSHFEIAKFIRALGPWVDYGFGVAMGTIRPDDADPIEQPVDQGAMLGAGLVVPQVHQVLDVLAAFHSHTSITYRDEDIWVTQAETRFQDVP